MLLVNGLFFIYTSRTYTVVPSVTVPRLSQLTQLVKSSRLLYCSVSGTSGAVLTWACTGMLGARYSGLSYRCAKNSELYCINEYHLFLVLYGIYSGVMFVFYHFYKQQNYLQFPPLKEAKFFQVRGKVLDVFYSSVGHVLWQIKFFYILYYFTGSIPRGWIADSLSLRYGSEYRLDSLYGLLLDFRLLWQTFVCGLFLQFTWSYGALLYRVYNTEHFEFPIVSMFDNFKNKCLVDALSCRDVPLIQSLGFYDLNILSKYSITRRRELFSLSQPGGHPHNWNKIIAVCLSVVNELSDQIQDANWKILASAPVRQQNGDKHAAHNISTVGNGHAMDTSKTHTQLETKVTLHNKIFGIIKKLPGLNSLSTAEVPENKNKNLFLSCQIQVWSVEALSCLVEASYTEDNYGVVQMSLSNIITSILSLQENVEKHFKLTGGVTRRSQKDPPATDVTLKYLLQTTIKASIYRIVNTFGKHLMELHLPVETEKKIRHFIDFRE